MSAWVNFTELRGKLNFEEVLRHYGVEIQRKGKQHIGTCPLPRHENKRQGPSFSAHLERGIFQCFGCKAKGNVLEFAGLMEGVDPTDGKALRAVALKLQERFCPTLQSVPPATKLEESPAPVKADLPVVVNAPLDFELKNLEPMHRCLRSRSFLRMTIEYFGVGFTPRGFMKNRLAIPLHDQAGELIGYAGRIIDDVLIDAKTPKSLMPTRRERNGVVHDFDKSLFLYNGHRMKGPLEDLIVVQGFPAVWWLHQSGLPNAVTTMGADCSQRQAELIVELVKPLGRIWIMPDGNDAGERWFDMLARNVAPERFIRWQKLPHGSQPTDLSTSQLKQCFGK